MKTKEALDFFKSERMSGRQGLLQALNNDGWPISGEAISQWGKYPPLGRQFQIELLTGGKLKATTSDTHTTNLPAEA